MDEARVERALDHLIAAGLVEDSDEEIRGTRRWNALLQAAAEKLNILAAQTGVNPEGNPLVLATQQALAAANTTEDEALFRDCAEVLVRLELTRISPEKRSQLGF